MTARAKVHKTDLVEIKRLAVKVGTSTLMDEAGRLDRKFVHDLARQLCDQRNAGRDVILVTSGAIGVGRDHLKAGPHSAISSTLPYKQAAAAVGQGLLMHTYIEAFGANGQMAAQVLLTRNDLADRKRFLNARNTFSSLLAMGIIPVVNENDTVAVEEIKFGDNDTLAARVAVLVEADLLLVLSDVEGLYAASTAVGAVSEPPQPVVVRIDRHIEALAGDSTSRAGTGGMKTKLEAARIATASGIRTVIALGRRPGVVAEVVTGKQIGTTFLPGSGRLQGKKRWLAAGSRAKGVLTVNNGALKRIQEDGVSLLSVGVVHVAGDFKAGELIEIHDEEGRRFARGLANYAASDIRLIQGMKSTQIEEVVGFKTHDEVVHRDNMVVEI
jgi:glutamate 5-kinase